MRKLFILFFSIFISIQTINAQDNKIYFNKRGILTTESGAYYYRVETGENEYKSYYISNGNLYFEGKINTISNDESITCTITTPEAYSYYRWYNSEYQYSSYDYNYNEGASYTELFNNNGTYTITLVAVNEFGGDSSFVNITVGNYGIVKCTGTITFYDEPEYCIISLYQNSSSEDILQNIQGSSFVESGGYFRYDYDLNVNLSTLANVDPQQTLSFRVVGKELNYYYIFTKYDSFNPSNNEFSYNCTFS